MGRSKRLRRLKTTNDVVETIIRIPDDKYTCKMCVVRTSSQRHSEQSFTYKTVPGTVYHMIRTSMLIGSMHRNVFDLVQNKYTRVIRLSVLYKTNLRSSSYRHTIQHTELPNHKVASNVIMIAHIAHTVHYSTISRTVQKVARICFHSHGYCTCILTTGCTYQRRMREGRPSHHQNA